MSEGIKTLIFAAVAAVVVVVAVASRPSTSIPQSGEADGKPLFPEFKNPTDAREMKIVRFNETLGKFSDFQISQVGKRWVIPSHSDYPADAEAQLKEAALCLIDLTVLETKEITDPADAHKLFGVVEPDPEKLQPGDQGVGIMVSMKGAEGKDLAKLIISDKKVEGHADKRFVRKAGEDPVYVVKIDPAKLSTKFSDWIEKDLLKLDAFNVEQLELKDYTVAVVMTESGPRVSHNQRFTLTASQESGPGWKLDKLVNYRGQTPVPVLLNEDEELNSQKLDDVKSALDNLEIVNVRKKPKGLSANLRADEGLLKDRGEGFQSLVKLGFLPLQISQGGSAEIFAANGEVVCRMKDGVEYVLRFGNSAGAEDGADAAKLNRYLLVTAQVAESKFPPLELEPLPEDPPAEPAAPADKKQDDVKEEAKQDPSDEGAKDEPKKDDEKKEEKKEGEDEAKQKADAKKAADKKKAELKATRDRITKENQRKEDDYKARRKKAEDKVKELNARFADWYYVISEDVYKKVHLSRVDLVKEKTATKDEGFGVDAFRKLEEEGIKEPAKPAAGGFPPGGPGGPGGGFPPGLGLPPGE